MRSFTGARQPFTTWSKSASTLTTKRWEVKHLKPWMEMAGSDFIRALYHTTSYPFIVAFLPSVSKGFPGRGGPRSWLTIFWLREKFSEASLCSCSDLCSQNMEWLRLSLLGNHHGNICQRGYFRIDFAWSCLRCDIHVSFLVKVTNRIQKWWLFVLQKSCSRYWVVVIYFWGRI